MAKGIEKMDIHYTKKIDYKQLFRHVFKSWKVLVICGVIGAILCGGLSYVVSGKSTNDYQSEVNEAKANLSKTEISSTETAYKTQQDLDRQITKLRNRLDNSIYYNLNSNTASNIKIIYNVTSSTQTDSIIDAINSALINTTLSDALNKAASKTVSMTDAKKLISMSREDSSSTSNINVNLSSDTDHSQNFTISVLGENATEANAFANAVKARIKTLSTSLTKSLGNFKITEVSSVNAKIADADIADDKATYADKLSSLSNAKLSLTNTMSDAEKAYLDALSKDKTGNQAIPTSTKVVNGVKGVVVGFILFAALAFAWLGSKFILGKQMRSLQELQSINHMNIICEIDQDTTAAKDELSYLAAKYPHEVIGIISTCKDANVLAQIKTMMPESFVFLADKPATEADFKKLEQVKRVVVVEKMNVSLLNKIVEMVKYYVQKQISIAGAIVIK